ncbi:MAG: Gfo/Idh/MocA family protein [Halobacteriaceae archaeon]
MERALRVGIVGLGGMGTGHAGHVEAAGHEVVAGADVDADAQAAFAEEFGAATYGGHEAMYDAEDLDAAIVTTPNRFHEPAAVAALERGIPVEIEKPLAHDLPAAERIAAAARESEAFGVVGFNNRYTFPVETFKAYQAEGHFGGVNHVRAEWIRRYGGSPGPDGWFRDPELAGGGALIDIGVHMLDLALYMLDFPEVVEVAGRTRTDFLEGEDTVDDSVTALVRCAGGQTVSLEASWAARQRPSQRVVARGPDAGAEFERMADEMTLVEFGEQGVAHERDVELRGEMEPSAHAAEDRRFLAAVATGEPPANSIDDALTVQRVIDAIYRSSESGAAQRL